MPQKTHQTGHQLLPMAADWAAREEASLPWELTLLTVPVRGGSSWALDRLLSELRLMTARSAVRVALAGSPDGDEALLTLGLPPGATAAAMRPMIEHAVRLATTPDGDAL